MNAPATIRRLLFVDDEIDVLEALRATLRRERKRWLMHFCTSPKAALTVLERQSFDVVVTDVRMPEMDGATFLAEVRARRPALIRFVLSGDCDEATCLRALPNVHQWLTKPCDRDSLVHAIDRACNLRDLIHDEHLSEIVGSIDSLPVLPELYRKVLDRLADPEVSLPEVSELVRQDPALCAKFLQLVNSSFYGVQRQIVDVGEAVAYIGMRSVSQLVLASGAFEALSPEHEVEGCSFAGFQQDAVLTSRLASMLVARSSQGAVAATAGMLHDIGSLLLLRCVPERIGAMVREARQSGVPLHEIERRELGTTHGAVGGALLGLWGLPLDVVEAVAFHHDPDRISEEDLGPSSAVHLASNLIELGFEEREGHQPARASRLDPAFLERIQSSERAADFAEWAGRLIDQLVQEEAAQAGTGRGSTGTQGKRDSTHA